MLKFVIFGVAIGLVSAQNFKQVQTFPAQTIHFSQPEVQSQPQVWKQNLISESKFYFIE